MAEAKTTGYVFDLYGGNLSLDFVNTLNGSRTTGRTDEMLKGYAELVSWGRQTGVVTEAEARRLLREAARRPDEAQAMLKRAVNLRETIYRVVKAFTDGRSPAKADLSALNAEVSEALAHARIVEAEEGFEWSWSADGDALGRVLWPVARAAAELLTSEELSRARECGGDECTWLFVDVSKNGSRRWCDMKFCGNRAKSRRHYERKRSAKALRA